MKSILANTEQFVIELLTTKLDKKLLYHNLDHTRSVVNMAEELMMHSDLNDLDKEVVLLAAWLHDVGFTRSYVNHEQESCDIGKEFLLEQEYDSSQIDKICMLIKATELGYKPFTLSEKIIRDADTAHFNKGSFMATSELLREELSLMGIKQYSISEWRKENIKVFRTQHRFYTDYALDTWQKGKDSNLKKMIKNQKKEKKVIKKEKLKAKLKNQSPERGVQTMYRVAMRNHLKLSDIADTKANILLSVNAIVISMLLSNLIPKLDNPSNDYLVYPAAIFTLFSIVSMIMSVLATRPNVTRGEFDPEEVKNEEVNLLFFGNFHSMRVNQYKEAMRELIGNQRYLYDSLSKDLYFLGVVLNKKYKLLRITYTVFMVGMIISTLAFFLAFKFFGPERLLELPT